MPAKLGAAAADLGERQEPALANAGVGECHPRPFRYYLGVEVIVLQSHRFLSK
jgi:hypothetical protein